MAVKRLSEDEKTRRAEIGQRIRDARGPRPQELIADLVGVDRRTIQNWEAGNTEIRWHNRAKLAEALDADEEWLFAGKEPGFADALEDAGADAESLKDAVELASSELEDLRQQVADGLRLLQQNNDMLAKVLLILTGADGKAARRQAKGAQERLAAILSDRTVDDAVAKLSPRRAGSGNRNRA